MGRRVFEEGWMILFMYVASLWTPQSVSGIKNDEEQRMSSGYRKEGQRTGLAKQGFLSEININSDFSVTQKLGITSGTQNAPVINGKTAPKRLLTARVASREKQNETWKVSLADIQPEKGRLVPLLEFQRDNIMSANTFAMYNASWSNLQNFSLSFWINIYNWRYYSQIVSYALSLRRDNALLITQSQTGLEYRKDDIYFSVPWEDGVAYVQEWMHICLVVSSTAHKLYIDGIEVLNEKMASDSNQDAGNPPIALEGGGLLVLGQDQDKPGGGFEPKHSLSGSFADFQLFATILTPRDIRALHEFQALAQKSLLDLTDPKWLFQNVHLGTIRAESLFEMKVTGKFFLFFGEVDIDKGLKLCEDLGGELPSYDNVRQMLITMNDYFMYSSRDFFKLTVFIGHPSANTGKTFGSLKVIWEAEKYIQAAPNPNSPENSCVCRIKKQRYVRMFGVPEDMEYQIDSFYKLHLYKGSNQLQGLQKSYINYSDSEWRLQTKGLSENVVLMQFPSTSDYLPLGRKSWIVSNKHKSVKLLLTSCDRHQFTCDSGDCISLNLRCNTYRDCLDGSDEENCLPAPSSSLSGNVGPPLNSLSISGSVLFNNIPEVNVDKNFFSATMWINTTWRDKRLYLLNLRNKTDTILKAHLFNYNIWSPKLVLKPVQNDISTFLTTGTAKRLCDGEQKVFDTVEEMMFTYKCFEIWKRSLMYVMWQCEFNLLKFPFESVLCRLSVELDDDQLWHLVNVTLPEFSHLPYKVSVKSHDIKGPTVDIQLLFERKFGGYVVTTFIPIIILSAISIFTFLFEHQDFTNRIMVTVSLLIVVASLSAQTASSLPNTSYTKCIDLVFLCTIFFLSIVFGSHVICSVIWLRKKPADVHALAGCCKNSFNKTTKDAESRLNFLAASLCLLTAVACVFVCVSNCT